MDTREIKKMSRLERLKAMEALWDSLMEEEAENRVPGLASGHPGGEESKNRKRQSGIHLS